MCRYFKPITDVVLDLEHISGSNINLEVIRHVKNTVLRPVIAHCSRR